MRGLLLFFFVLAPSYLVKGGAFVRPKSALRLKSAVKPLKSVNRDQAPSAAESKPGVELAEEVNVFSAITARGGVTQSKGLKLVPPALALLSMVGATIFAVDGPMERTLWSTLLTCAGMAAYAYRSTIAAFFTGSSESSSVLTPERQKEFSAFQRRYLFVQLIATFVDFIQGPYLYKVYESYGYGMSEIARLYLIGFGSSALTSPVAGVLADKYGRRTGCMAFAAIQAVSCALLHKNDYALLCLGRFLSGVATSFLSTCFECWMVSEHSRRGFPGELLGGTFSAYVFLMGLVAVGSGAVAGYAERSYGVIAPFDVCIAAAVLDFIVLPIFWRPDNFGERKATTSGQRKQSVSEVFLGGKKQVLWVGLTQALFEVAMFTWVFMWTPALDTGEIPGLNLGIVFATLMLGTMIGSSSFSILTGDDFKLSPETVLLGALILATGCLGLSSLHVPASTLLILFVLYEACVGVYFAAIGTIRARFIPENQRATIMNWIRLLLNVLVVVMYLGPVGLKLDMAVKKPLVLGISSGFLLLACASHGKLISTLDKKEGRKE